MRAALQALVVVALAPNSFAEPPARARTLITVVTADWTATTGELRRWQRAGKTWQAIGAPIAVVVGKSGLRPAADKREGDGASPAGRFRLGDVTGYGWEPPRGLKLHYRPADHLVCYDDPEVREVYNLVRDARADDWEFGEPHFEWMRREDELYRYTIFVRHNVARRPGAGSCIFLHVWKSSRSPTVGCTAMALDDLRTLLGWVDRSTELVQLPRAEYEARQRAWELPPLDDGQRK